MKKKKPGGKWRVAGDGNGKAVIVLDIGDKQVQKHENSHYSRLLGFWQLFGSHLLPCNPFQLEQTNGFLGFPGNFSGGGIPGGGSKNPNLNPSQRYLKFGRRGAPPSREGRAPRAPEYLRDNLTTF
ncbi:MAG: hypothetical protein ABSA83_04595 [Verrucomicrobiota bacterium]|jgi:hypothetical protein